MLDKSSFHSEQFVGTLMSAVQLHQGCFSLGHDAWSSNDNGKLIWRASSAPESTWVHRSFVFRVGQLQTHLLVGACRDIYIWQFLATKFTSGSLSSLSSQLTWLMLNVIMRLWCKPLGRSQSCGHLTWPNTANKANMATNQCPQRPQRRFHFLQNFAIFVHFSDKRGQKKTLQSASRPRHCGRAGLFVLPLVIHQLLIRTSPTSLLLNAFAVTWHSETARKHGKNGKTKVED